MRISITARVYKKMRENKESKLTGYDYRRSTVGSRKWSFLINLTKFVLICGIAASLVYISLEIAPDNNGAQICIAAGTVVNLPGVGGYLIPDNMVWLSALQVNCTNVSGIATFICDLNCNLRQLLFCDAVATTTTTVNCLTNRTDWSCCSLNGEGPPMQTRNASTNGNVCDMSLNRTCIPCDENIPTCEYKLCPTIVYLGGEGAADTSLLSFEKTMYAYPANTIFPSMPSPENKTKRIDFGCVFLKGSIYVFGGYRYCISGNGCTNPSAFPPTVIPSMIMYNIWNNTWNVSLPSMNTPRRNFASAVLNGAIFAIGGIRTNNTVLNTSDYIDAVETYIPGELFWKNDTSLPFFLAFASAVVLNGSLYVIGGESKINNQDAYFHTLLLYEKIQWRIMAPMNSNRAGASSTVYRGNIYVMGGNQCSSPTFSNSNYSLCTVGVAVPTMEIYALNNATQNWSWSEISFGNATSSPSLAANITLMPVTSGTAFRNRYEGALVALGDFLYAMGGSADVKCTQNRLNSVFKYNVRENEWITNAPILAGYSPLASRRCGLRAVVVE